MISMHHSILVLHVHVIDERRPNVQAGIESVLRFLQANPCRVTSTSRSDTLPVEA